MKKQETVVKNLPNSLVFFDDIPNKTFFVYKDCLYFKLISGRVENAIKMSDMSDDMFPNNTQVSYVPRKVTFSVEN